MKARSFFILAVAIFLLNGCQEESLRISDNGAAQDPALAFDADGNIAKYQNKLYVKTGLVSRFEFDLRVFRDGQLTIDWGDGKREKVRLVPEEQNFIGHNYSSKGAYMVTFNGSIKNIYAFITNPSLNAINTKGLTALEILLVTHSHAPSYDLSSNTNLQQVSIRALADHTFIKMPATHDIWYASFNDSSIRNLDEIISSIHSNAVSKEIFEGVIYLQGLRQHYPSQASLDKLSDLSVHYNWTINL